MMIDRWARSALYKAPVTVFVSCHTRGVELAVDIADPVRSRAAGYVSIIFISRVHSAPMGDFYIQI